MILEEVIPYLVCLNLGCREDRRRAAWSRFEEQGLDVDRQPAVAGWQVRDPRGYQSKTRYACSLSKRLAIRRSKLAGAPAMLLFEDDVVLAPDLHERLAEIELPDDWGIFFLGCAHSERPVPVGPGLVKVGRAIDHHAIAIRGPVYREAMRALAGLGKGAAPAFRFSDVKFSEIQRRVPTYAAFPNLAWQQEDHSDAAGRKQRHYNDQGRQLKFRGVMDGFAGEMEQAAVDGWPESVQSGTVPRGSGTLEPGAKDRPGSGGQAFRSAKHSPDTGSACSGVRGADENAQLGDRSPQNDEPMDFEFLSDAPRKHRFEETFPLAFYINLGRREDRRSEVLGQFSRQGLAVERRPAVDGRSATDTRGHGKPNRYACRLSHRLAIRDARQRAAPSIVVFEDDVVLHGDFRRLIETLELPKDWGVILFGCTHVTDPEVVSPGWLRVRRFWGMHAYAVRSQCYPIVLKALQERLPPGGILGTDEAISRLSGVIPIYSVYPNLAWQAEGVSDLLGTTRRHFDEDGRQKMRPRILRGINRVMREMLGRS